MTICDKLIYEIFDELCDELFDQLCDQLCDKVFDQLCEELCDDVRISGLEFCDEVFPQGGYSLM